MSKNNCRLGGFAAQNSGQIDDCFSLIKIDVKGESAGSFLGENSGAVSRCYSIWSAKQEKNGFVGNDTGRIDENCYFFHSQKRDNKKIKELLDCKRAIAMEDWEEETDMEKIKFDNRIWQFGGKKCPMLFQADNWICQIPSVDVKGRKKITISNAYELRDFAEEVNDGNREMADAYVVLTEDIKLGGKEWTPIGSSRKNAFTGVFDGAGHVISHFVIKNKKTEDKGFFGFLQGVVCNLSVDCQLKGGIYVGGIAAHNEKGIISCCSANVDLLGNISNGGGLVGLNSGRVFQSYAAGRSKIVAIPLLWWGIPAIAVVVGGTCLIATPPNIPSKLPTYAPVPYDEDAIPIEDDSETPNTDGNFVSFQFKQEMTVDLATGLCNFEFKNPGNSNHNIVVQLQFTDAQAIRIMGSTGRSSEEQERLNNTEGYDPETYRCVIAESGSIPPGYQLDDLRLVSLENGAALPAGTYNAMIYLVFYDIETNDRAMLESQLPVEITVE